MGHMAGGRGGYEGAPLQQLLILQILVCKYYFRKIQILYWYSFSEKVKNHIRTPCFLLEPHDSAHLHIEIALGLPWSKGSKGSRVSQGPDRGSK